MIELFIYHIGRRMQWFRKWYYKRYDTWHWGIVTFINEIPSGYDKAVHKKELRKLIEEIFKPN